MKSVLNVGLFTHVTLKVLDIDIDDSLDSAWLI